MTHRTGIFVLVLSVFSLLLLTACGGGANPIVGEWEAAKPAITFKFFQDGTVTLKQDGRTFTGQYKSLDSENIRIDMQGDLGLQSFVLEDIKIAGDTLTAALNGQQVVFSRASKSSSQSPSDSQAAPASPISSKADLDLNSLEALVGKWELQSSVVEFVLEPDGRLSLLGSGGTYLDVKPNGNGKFSGYIVFAPLASGRESQRQALEIQMSGDGQKLDWRQENNEGKWNSTTSIRFDETKPPTATPVVGSNRIPNPSFEEGATLPAGWLPKDKTTSAYVWDGTQSHSGQHSLAIVGPVPESREITWESSDWIPIDPNHEYKVGVWYRSNLPKESPPTFHILSENGRGTFALLEIVSGSWQYAETTFKPQPEDRKTKLSLRLGSWGSSVAAAGQGIWIDDISFAEIQ